MLDADIFVGSVAIVVGAVVVSAAIFNWEWYYQLHKARWIESFCGRSGARAVFAVVGLGLIVLGSAIALGHLSNKDTSSNSERPRNFGKAIAIAGVFADVVAA